MHADAEEYIGDANELTAFSVPFMDFSVTFHLMSRDGKKIFDGRYISTCHGLYIILYLFSF